VITILSWYWRQEGGRTRFEPWHVNTWAEMVRRNVLQPHRIACVTATPEGLNPGIEIIAPPGEFESVRIPTWKEHRPQCLRRLSMFRPDAAAIFGDRFVCMDLDCVIAGPLDPLFTNHDFRIFKGTNPRRPYNGSMMMLRAGARPEVYTEFSPEAAIVAGQRFMGSDQAWIMHRLGPGEATWSAGDGVDWWWEGTGAPIPRINRLLFFMGTVKPWDRLDAPQVAEHYRVGTREGWCLVLGRGATVWQEAEKALERGMPDAVIVMGEAEQHWPGRIDAVARHERHARELAATMGLADVVVCGQTADGSDGPRYSEKLRALKVKRGRLAAA
jgi:hypothetical protein